MCQLWLATLDGRITDGKIPVYPQVAGCWVITIQHSLLDLIGHLMDLLFCWVRHQFCRGFPTGSSSQVNKHRFNNTYTRSPFSPLTSLVTFIPSTVDVTIMFIFYTPLLEVWFSSHEVTPTDSHELTRYSDKLWNVL